MLTTLNTAQWEVQGYWPWTPFLDKSVETGLELQGITDWLPAHVPGGIHDDLLRAGWIENPWVDMNSGLCEWVEHRWWVYRTTVDTPPFDPKTGQVFLIFKGLDDRATVVVNGVNVGTHEGPFEPAHFNITACCRRESILHIRVIFHGIPDEMGQIGYTSRTHTQKSRFGYKWDFSTHMVNIGLWDEVALQVIDHVSLDNLSVTTTRHDGEGVMMISFTVMPHTAPTQRVYTTIRVEDPQGLSLPEQTIAVDVAEDAVHVSATVRIAHPELWYPNGYGPHPLYSLSITLYHGQRVVDNQHLFVGVRSLEYVANDGAPDALPYTFVINGEKIYVQGVNLVPLDHLYGTLTPARYKWVVQTMAQAHVNLVRVWGGGIIEREIFYSLCDRYGILVWQDFTQSSSGIDNVPSNDPAFLSLLQRTAVAALREKRNHVSLSVWVGGNELNHGGVPVGYDDKNVAMLRALVNTWDPQRLFLPTTGSGPVDTVTDMAHVAHDVHGQWQYLGNPTHYQFYSQSDSLFHSEFGAPGLSPLKSLRKFLTASHLGVHSMQEDRVWRFHGEWWDTLQRDQALFGPLTSIETFIDSSQWIQAEAIRYIVDMNRRRQFRNSGSIIWQLNEPWPNVSATSLMDYFGERKMAYYWVKKAYAPLTPLLTYERLNFAVGDTFHADLSLTCAPTTTAIRVTATVWNHQGACLYRQTSPPQTVPRHGVVALLPVAFPVTEAMAGIFVLRIDVSGCSEQTGLSRSYIFSTRPSPIYAEALTLPLASLDVSSLADWEDIRQADDALPVYQRAYHIANHSDHLALHVRAEETTDDYWMDCSDNYFTLMAHEERTITVTCARKDLSGLLAPFQRRDSPDYPSITFRSFNQALSARGQG